MHQHHRAVMRIVQHRIMNGLRTGHLPILRIDIPQHVHVKQVGALLPLFHAERAIWGTHHLRFQSGCLLQIVKPCRDLRAQLVTPHLRHVWMRVAVTRHLMTFCKHALLLLRVLRGAFADVEERRLHAFLLEYVQNRVAVLAWPVVERQCDYLTSGRSWRTRLYHQILRFLLESLVDFLLGSPPDPNLFHTVLAELFDFLQRPIVEIDVGTVFDGVVPYRMRFGLILTGFHGDYVVVGHTCAAKLRGCHGGAITFHDDRSTAALVEDLAGDIQQTAWLGVEIIVVMEQGRNRAVDANETVDTIDGNRNAAQMIVPQIPAARCASCDQYDQQHRKYDAQPSVMFARRKDAILKRQLFNIVFQSHAGFFRCYCRDVVLGLPQL